MSCVDASQRGAEQASLRWTARAETLRAPLEALQRTLRNRLLTCRAEPFPGLVTGAYCQGLSLVLLAGFRSLKS
jgi:hypothetical protein